MMLTECLAWMSSVGWPGWLMPLSMLLLVGLLVAALVKFLFFNRGTVDTVNNDMVNEHTISGDRS